MKAAFITDAQIARAIGPSEAFSIAKETLRSTAAQKTLAPPKLYLPLPFEDRRDFRAMPAWVSLGNRRSACGIKWVGVFPSNPSQARPTVVGTVLLNSPSSGALLAVLEASTLTALRTAAVSAVASALMANPRPKVLALVGAGLQARYQLRAHLSRYKSIRSVRVWGYRDGEAERFCREERPLIGGLCAVRTPREAVEGADIVVSCTPSRKPLIRRSWISPGTHVNAIGADAKGKQEFESSILRSARVIVDEWHQAAHSGEINVPVSRGQFSRRRCAGELWEVVSGKVAGRKHPREITFFDSTGLAVFDIAFAAHAYARLTGKDPSA